MFGYIKPYVPELKVKENEFYRATYCGLCRALGRKSRFLSLTLSYDFVFLAIVRMAVEKEPRVELGKERCIAHPMKKRAYLKTNPQLEHTARAAALLLYYNLLDDIDDSKGIKKLGARLALPVAKALRKKNLGDGVLDTHIAKQLLIMAEEEKRESGSVYDLAEPFGVLLGEVFANGVEDKSTQKALFAFGRHIGRWIYIVDALDDIEKDIKSGSLNRLIAERERDGEQGFAKDISNALIMELTEAEKVLDLLDIEDDGLLNIIKNVIYLGMPEEVQRILNGKRGRDKDKKGNRLK